MFMRSFYWPIADRVVYFIVASYFLSKRCHSSLSLGVRAKFPLDFLSFMSHESEISNMAIPICDTPCATMSGHVSCLYHSSKGLFFFTFRLETRSEHSSEKILKV